MPRCPDDEALASFGARALRGASHEALARHVDACDSCREVVGAFARRSTFLERLRAIGSGDEATGASPRPGPRVGETLGRYALLRHLGRGAMGEVFAGYDPELERMAAIKVLPEGGGDRLRLEAAALARLSHPNVVTVYEVGRDRDIDFMAMELVDGLDLAEWMAAARRSPAQLLARAIELGRGLAAVHRCGLIHRDVKPENVLVGRDGRLRLGDFGLARAADATEGELAGTPRYMAPEQARREALGPEADQYGFALTCLELWLGEAPATPETAGAQRSELPAPLRRVLDRATKQEPSERYPSMDELVSELEFLARRPRRRAVVAFTAALIALGLGGGAVAMSSQGSADPCATPAALDQVWNEDRRASLAAALGAGTAPFTADAAARTLRGLDERVARLRSSHRSVCRATAIDHTQSDALLDTRMQCLAEIRARMDQTISVLVDTGAVRAAAEVLDDLPAPEVCEQAQTGELVLGPEARQRRQRATAALARARALERAGSLADARAAYTAAAPESPDLAAERELGLARIADAAGDFDAVRDHARAALADAEAAGDDAARAEAVAMLMRRVTERLGRVEAAGVLMPVLEAMSEGSPAGSRARGESLRALGAYHRLAGDYPRAAALFRTAAESAVSPFDRARSLGDLCLAFRMAGERDRAEQACDDAVSALVDIVGPDHPMLGATLANRAAVLHAAGAGELALSELGRAIDILERGLGAKHPTTLAARRNRGSLLSELGREDEAIATWRAILAEWEYSQRDTPRLAALYRDLASSLLATGQRQEAAALQKRAVELYASLFPDGHPDRALAILGAAEIALEDGDWSSACQDAERARAMLDALDARDLVIHPLFVLAQCEEHGGDLVAARGHLERALASADHPGARLELQVALAELSKRSRAPRAVLEAEVARALELLEQTGGDPERRAGLLALLPRGSRPSAAKKIR